MFDLSWLLSAPLVFVAVTLAAPFVSWVALRRERWRLAATFRPRPLAPIFFTEVLLWMAGACVVGPVLVGMVALVVVLNTHSSVSAGYRGPSVVSWVAVAVAYGLIGVHAVYGLWLHAFTARKLFPPDDPLNVLSLKGR